jgi:hypothetical protein
MIIIKAKDPGVNGTGGGGVPPLGKTGGFGAGGKSSKPTYAVAPGVGGMYINIFMNMDMYRYVYVKLYRHICKYLNIYLYIYTPKYVYTAMGTVGTLGGLFLYM